MFQITADRDIIEIESIVIARAKTYEQELGFVSGSDLGRHIIGKLSPPLSIARLHIDRLISQHISHAIDEETGLHLSLIRSTRIEEYPELQFGIMKVGEGEDGGPDGALFRSGATELEASAIIILRIDGDRIRAADRWAPSGSLIILHHPGIIAKSHIGKRLHELTDVGIAHEETGACGDSRSLRIGDSHDGKRHLILTCFRHRHGVIGGELRSIVNHSLTVTLHEISHRRGDKEIGSRSSLSDSIPREMELIVGLSYIEIGDSPRCAETRRRSHLGSGREEIAGSAEERICNTLS